MKENKYDNPTFFEKYSQMDRSTKGLAGAGEWPALQSMLPDFTGKNVLDLGCGFGWHCQYAVDQGAASVVGVDLSRRMLEQAERTTDQTKITYLCQPIEEIQFAPSSFDLVISSLTFHYIADFKGLCAKIREMLTPGGDFVFSVEHPIFTAHGSEQWVTDPAGKPLYWPVDRYFSEGLRETVFLEESVKKYHKTLTSYLEALLENGFSILRVVEPTPSEELLRTVPGMEEELRRPMMLLVACQKSEA